MRRVGARFAGFLVLVLCLAGLGTSASALADVGSAPLPGVVANRNVNAIVKIGDTVYLGGEFNRIGPQTGLAAAVSPVTGQPDLEMPQVSGLYAKVWAVAADGHGGWYVGGNFDHVGGVPRANVAHITADKTVDLAWDPEITGGDQVLNGVSGIAVGPDGKVYVAGSFASVGDRPRNGLAAIDPITGRATDWNPAPDGTVGGMAISSHGSMYVTGTFSHVGTGQSARNGVAEVSLASAAATAWNPALVAPTYVKPVAIGPDGLVYVGGQFSVMGANNVSRSDLAALDPITGNATAWNPNVDNGVADAVVYVLDFGADGTVYAGGVFTSIGANQAARANLAALDPKTANATVWDPMLTSGICPTTNTFINGLGVGANGTVYVAGYFGKVGPSQRPRRNLAALDPVTAEATSWDPEPFDVVRTLALDPDGTVYVGGEFSGIGGVSRRALAAVRASDGSLTDFDAKIDAHVATPSCPSVEGLASAGDNKLYVAGGMGTIGANDAPRTHLAEPDLTTGNATSWNPNINGYVTQLDIGRDGTVYVIGFIQSVAGQPRDNTAALDPDTGAPLAWNPRFTSSDPAVMLDANLKTIKVGPDGNVYVGGQFALVDGQARANVAALDPMTGVPTSWNPGTGGTGPDIQGDNGNPEVNALAFDGQHTVYVGGAFSTIGANGATRPNLAAVDLGTGNASSWKPAPSGRVAAVAIGSDGVIYVGGNFDSAGVHPEGHRFLSGIDAGTGEATKFFPEPFGNVTVLEPASDGRLYAGGYFTSMGYGGAQHFAVFGPPTVSRNTSPPTISGTAAIGQPLTCTTGEWTSANGRWFSFQWRRDASLIPGATKTTYTVTTADGGHNLACAVTATTADGSATAQSSAVSIPPPDPVPGPPPVNGPPDDGGDPQDPHQQRGDESAGKTPATSPSSTNGDRRPPNPLFSNRLAIASPRTLRAARGVVQIGIHCTGVDVCRVRATLALRGAPHAASATRSIRAGSTRVVALRLAARARRILGRHRHLAATLRLIPLDPGVQLVRHRVTLRG